MAMTAITAKDFDRNLRPRERNGRLPRIALRQRSADHPMILFFLVILTAFMAMALVPPSGIALTSLAGSTTATPPAEAGAPKTVGLSEIDVACHGQAWGAESAECLAVIAKDSGRPDGRPVRVIAGA